MKKIIALIVLKGSGKDTTADYIISNYPNWEKDSFVNTLKDAVFAIFGDLYNQIKAIKEF